jgi:hypothetical protein
MQIGHYIIAVYVNREPAAATGRWHIASGYKTASGWGLVILSDTTGDDEYVWYSHRLRLAASLPHIMLNSITVSLCTIVVTLARMLN